MDEENSGDFRAELAFLEAEEMRISAERRHLHRQIDFGYANDAARARERELSDRRRELHRRIDELRKQLGMPVGPPRVSAETERDRAGHDSPIGELERIGDDAQKIPRADPQII